MNIKQKHNGGLTMLIIYGTTLLLSTLTLINRRSFHEMGNYGQWILWHKSDIERMNGVGLKIIEIGVWTNCSNKPYSHKSYVAI